MANACDLNIKELKQKEKEYKKLCKSANKKFQILNELESNSAELLNKIADLLSSIRKGTVKFDLKLSNKIDNLSKNIDVLSAEIIENKKNRNQAILDGAGIVAGLATVGYSFWDFLKGNSSSKKDNLIKTIIKATCIVILLIAYFIFRNKIVRDANLNAINNKAKIQEEIESLNEKINENEIRYSAIKLNYTNLLNDYNKLKKYENYDYSKIKKNDQLKLISLVNNSMAFEKLLSRGNNQYGEE